MLKLANMLYRLTLKGIKYSIVGLGTFLLDLAIIYSLVTYTDTPQTIAIATGFIVGISLDFYIIYHWVYKGTERSLHHGYIYFVSLAFLGMLIISTSTTFLVDQFGIPLLIARTLVGIVTGVIGFLINTFYNFKLP